jgi:hypothetical protein
MCFPYQQCPQPYAKKKSPIIYKHIHGPSILKILSIFSPFFVVVLFVKTIKITTQKKKKQKKKKKETFASILYQNRKSNENNIREVVE